MSGATVAFDGTVIDYCTEEVYRQGHNTEALDGIERVGWMLNAWRYALLSNESRPNAASVIALGKLVEPIKNRTGVRKVGVRVGQHVCPEPRKVRLLLESWEVRKYSDALDAYRGLLEIHPFVDGNGRTGKIVLNWLNGTLLRPVFPPNDFWGRWIQNP